MLTFRAPDDLRSRIEEFAGKEGVPRSEAIRRLVEKGLDAK
jgi:metal-responsive CopG/Arc/MetJ family transcriptional regulator